MEKYKTAIITSIDEALILDWKQLWERAENASVFNSYSWFLTLLQTNSLKEYEIHICYKAEKLVAIMPLCRYTRFGIKVSGSIGNKFLVDTPFLAETYDNELLTHFFNGIITKRNIFLQKVDDRAAQVLQNIFPGMFSLISVNPTVDLTGELFASLSPSTLSQIKKIIRKNPDQFNFKLFTGNEITEKHVQMMFTIEQHSAKKLRAMDIFSEQKTKDFFTVLTRNFAESVRIGFLYYNHEPIAYQFGFFYKEIFVAYQTAYLTDYRKLRPGKTMLFYLQAYLKEHEVKLLDLGGGMSTYKLEFTSDYRKLYDVYYAKNSLIMLWWKCINLMRRIKQIVAPTKNTRDHEFLFKPLDNL